MMVKSFTEFINETYLDEPVDPKYLKHDFKKMKKHGYISVELLKDSDGIKKGTEMMVSSEEFGILDDDALVTCYGKDGKEIMVVKSDVKVK